MNRLLFLTLGLALAPAAHAGSWVEDRYPAMSQAIEELGVTPGQQARFNTLYNALKAPGALRCDGSAPAGSRWDQSCVGTIAEQDATTCGVLAATGAMEGRLLQLAHGLDRTVGIVLTCGSVRATASARKHGTHADDDGRVQVDVRASSGAADSIAVWSRRSTAVAGWAVATGADRVLTADEAMAQVNDALRVRGPVDDAWVAMGSSLSGDMSRFEGLRVKLRAVAKAAADTTRAAPATPSDPAVHLALLARLDAYVAIANKLVVFLQLAEDESTFTAAQALLDQAGDANTAADKAFMEAVQAFGSRYGLSASAGAAP